MSGLGQQAQVYQMVGGLLGTRPGTPGCRGSGPRVVAVPGDPLDPGKAGPLTLQGTRSSCLSVGWEGLQGDHLLPGVLACGQQGRASARPCSG